MVLNLCDSIFSEFFDISVGEFKCRHPRGLLAFQSMSNTFNPFDLRVRVYTPCKYLGVYPAIILMTFLHLTLAVCKFFMSPLLAMKKMVNNCKHGSRKTAEPCICQTYVLCFLVCDKNSSKLLIDFMSNSPKLKQALRAFNLY